jgi:hypothetical protein
MIDYNIMTIKLRLDSFFNDIQIGVRNFIKMRYWRHFRDSLGETSVMITYVMIDYNDNKA